MSNSKRLQPPIVLCILLFCAIAAQGAHGEEAGSERSSIAGQDEAQADQQSPTAEDLRKELEKDGPLFWVQIALLGGGALIGTVGMLWSRVARVARHFGKDLNEGRAIWVLFIGLAILGLGLAMYWLPK